MQKRSKVTFLLASLGVILLASIPVFVILTGGYSQRLEGLIGRIGTRQNNLQRIEEVFTLLYSAENNFRIYTLTRDEPRATLYRHQLMEISGLLDEISVQYAQDSSLGDMLDQKKTEMALLLSANVYSDSLWEQALYLESHPGDFLFYSPVTPATGHPATEATDDSSIVESYLVYQRRHKGLLGRIKDAILDNGTVRADSIRTVKTIGVRDDEAKRRAGAKELDTTQISVNLWSNVLDQLNSARGGLQAKDMALLRSNEAMFSELKSAMNRIRRHEFELVDSQNQAAARHTRELLNEFRGKRILMAAFIIILALIILWFIWRFYKNGELLLDAKRKAENFARLKTTFAATASHEIRGLTHAINASVETLNEKQPFSRKKETLQNMQQSWETLLAMLNNILDYTRIEQAGGGISRAPFSPGKAIRTVLTTMKARAKNKSLDLVAVVELPERLAVLGNEGQFTQILINLLGNALKFTFEGSVTLKAFSEKTASGEILLTVSIKDTGRGMEKKHLAVIFNEFQQIDPEKDERVPQGSGLGLAIVKKIIEQHAGKIDVKSEPGKGSEFTFQIPYTPAPDWDDYPGPQPAAGEAPQGLRVLMVENDLLHRKYLGMLLKKAHMVVMEASDGQSALEVLETREVDVVLTDIHMPGMDGYELVMRIRRHTGLQNPSVPVIALTGTASEEDIARFREVGMNDYMVKPFTPKDLLRKLSDIMSSVSN